MRSASSQAAASSSAGESLRPKVSIITPAYNRAPFLPMCLESVRSQSYSNIEHIVVDGGSTDGTQEILKSWEGTYDLRWVSEPDQGMYDAINKGFRMATGQILAYVNTDDAYFPWSVQVAVDALTHGEDVVFGDLLVVKEVAGKPVSYVQFYPAFEMGHYVWTQTLGQPTVFWRREVFEAVGEFDTSFKLIADCDRWLSFARAGYTPRKLDEVLAVQIDHGETLRESHAELLQAEFRRLRSSSSECAPEPRSVRARRLRLSAWWRAQNLALLRAYRSKEPSRWPRFVAYLKANNVRFNADYALAGILPGPLRMRLGSTMLDGDAVVSAITSGSHRDKP
jgi:glycosyltransferase involved in cell wall biosynthesis